MEREQGKSIRQLLPRAPRKGCLFHLLNLTTFLFCSYLSLLTKKTGVTQACNEVQRQRIVECQIGILQIK